MQCAHPSTPVRARPQTMTRMRTSKAVLLTPPGPSNEELMESVKSGAVLDLEETALADELAAEANKAQ